MSRLVHGFQPLLDGPGVFKQCFRRQRTRLGELNLEQHSQRRAAWRADQQMPIKQPLNELNGMRLLSLSEIDSRERRINHLWRRRCL